ncbi:MAG: phenylacetate--CoA ligase, partial [Chloroflexota bacterium]|nr:phenylacetate--CoA ligase [Chloroflexota bacterium]MEE3249880.1 phenylacetate--CoA ligase [Chloroflexota bacterium]
MHSPPWEAVETISREGMEQLQVERLQSCLANVKEQVAFYSDQLAGTAPESVQSLGDLSRLPFTNKQD